MPRTGVVLVFIWRVIEVERGDEYETMEDDRGRVMEQDGMAAGDDEGMFRRILT